MNNEPVAWIEPDVIPLTHIIKAVVRREMDEQYSIPLYTQQRPHNTVLVPCDKLAKMQAEIKKLKAKMSFNSYDNVKNVANQLTDEEIMKIWGEEDIELYYPRKAFIDFARAILRKAQEK